MNPLWKHIYAGRVIHQWPAHALGYCRIRRVTEVADLSVTDVAARKSGERDEDNTTLHRCAP
jgi:hypothetical protein